MQHQKKLRKTIVKRPPLFNQTQNPMRPQQQLFDAFEPHEVKQKLFDLMVVYLQSDICDQAPKEDRTDMADFFYILNMDADAVAEFETSKSN